MLSVARGVVKLVNDATKMQSVQVDMLENETRDKVEHFQPYGLTSNPHPGAEGVVVAVGGNRDHSIAIVVDDRRYRVNTLASGEVCIYTDEGDKIHLQRGRVIEVVTGTLTVNASEAINLNAPTINASGESFNVEASDTATFTTPVVNASAEIMAQGNINDLGGGNGTVNHIRTVYNSHTHNENNTPGGPTQIPNQLLED